MCHACIPALDGEPTDHYLWLTGEAAKMLKKEKPLALKMPGQLPTRLKQNATSPHNGKTPATIVK